MFRFWYPCSCSGFVCLCCFGGVVCFYGFFVCLFLKKNSGFMGLLKIELVTRFMGLFLRFIYGLVWLLGFISCFCGFDGVYLVGGFGFGVCWRLVYFVDLGRTRRTTSVLTEKKKKFKFCFLIYFLFWFKFSDMAFKKYILKC